MMAYLPGILIGAIAGAAGGLLFWNLFVLPQIARRAARRVAVEAAYRADRADRHAAENAARDTARSILMTNELSDYLAARDRRLDEAAVAAADTVAAVAATRPAPVPIAIDASVACVVCHATVALPVTVCGACGAVHHAACWGYNSDKCARYGCRGRGAL